MPNDATLTQRDEVANVMRCLRESLREPEFARALIQLVAGNWQDEKREIADGLQTESVR